MYFAFEYSVHIRAIGTDENTEVPEIPCNKRYMDGKKILRRLVVTAGGSPKGFPSKSCRVI